MLVDYHRSPLGAWTAILVPDGLEPVALQATSAHDAFHKATELIEVLSEHADVAISTMHTLDGDPAAWATLAAREGFVDCAMSDNTLAALITHNWTESTAYRPRDTVAVFGPEPKLQNMRGDPATS